ncbi:MAG: hypothetical protein Q7S75_03745 [bacterium]|nr:hypothetical protein [bacterium]
MFFNAPGNPSSLKKSVYFISTIILGILLSFLVHAFIEMSYLSWMDGQGRIVTFYGNCALPPALQIGLLALGVIGGFLLGRIWWRKVYVERVWAKARR